MDVGAGYCLHFASTIALRLGPDNDIRYEDRKESSFLKMDYRRIDDNYKQIINPDEKNNKNFCT